MHKLDLQNLDYLFGKGGEENSIHTPSIIEKQIEGQFAYRQRKK